MENLTYPFIDLFLRISPLLGPILIVQLFCKKISLPKKFLVLWLSFYVMGLFFGEVRQMYLKTELSICNEKHGVVSPDQTAESCVWLMYRVSSDTGRALFPILGVFTGLLYALLAILFVYIVSKLKLKKN
jgi:hypothetical protein